MQIDDNYYINRTRIGITVHCTSVYRIKIQNKLVIKKLSKDENSCKMRMDLFGRESKQAK